MVDDGGNRAARRASKAKRARAAGDRGDGGLDTDAFLKTVGKFIEIANRENRTIPATELHIAFLYAAARYNAHVAKVVLNVADHEHFVADMTSKYGEMLRQQLADDSLDPPE